MNAFASYIQGSIEELRHVRWPTQQQAVRLTVIVVIFIAISAIAFGAIDAFFTAIISTTLKA